MLERCLVLLLAGIIGGIGIAGAAPPGEASSQAATGRAKQDYLNRFIIERKKGYIARPCGFDMNRNGAIGERADAHVGDGKTKDPDNDGVEDECDNCPINSNPDQADEDGDGLGDACDYECDFNSDGNIDDNDFNIFKSAFGHSQG